MSDNAAVEIPPRNIKLSNSQYDVAKWVAQILLPAAGALYFTLSQIWGLPKAEEVVGTITAVDLFLGLLLGVSARNYGDSDAKYDGVMHVGEDRDRLELNEDIDSLENKKELLFKVVPPTVGNDG